MPWKSSEVTWRLVWLKMPTSPDSTSSGISVRRLSTSLLRVLLSLQLWKWQYSTRASCLFTGLWNIYSTFLAFRSLCKREDTKVRPDKRIWINELIEICHERQHLHEDNQYQSGQGKTGYYVAAVTDDSIKAVLSSGKISMWVQLTLSLTTVPSNFCFQFQMLNFSSEVIHSVQPFKAYLFCFVPGCTLDIHHGSHNPVLSIITSFQRFFVTSLKLKWCFARLFAKLMHSLLYIRPDSKQEIMH